MLNLSDIEASWVLALYSLYPVIAFAYNVCWDSGLQRLNAHFVIRSGKVGMYREGGLLYFGHID